MAKQSCFSADDLIAEGERLSRPCLLLGSFEKAEVLGYWGGKGHQPLPDGYFLDDPSVKAIHWISFDCAWLAKQGILPPFFAKSHLSVYERMLVHQDFIWVTEKVPLAEASIDGDPLYARQAVSFPPFEAVCMYGGPAVEAWISSLGLRRIDYEHPTLCMSDVGQKYYAEWERRTPWARGGDDGTAAMLGGWHQMWPEDDFYVPPETQPVLWTVRDSEPWVEVRRGSRNFLVFSRAT